MELLSSRRWGSEWLRSIYIDLRNLLANPIAFTLPTLLILVVNLAYLNAVITAENQSEHLLPIATFLLLSAFLSSLLTIPFEIREGYAERIQIEFGSFGRRLVARIQANAIIGLALTLIPYLALTLQERFQRLTLEFELEKFALLAVATVYLTTFATLIGAIWGNYLALSLLGAAILILQVAYGFSSHSGWAFSSLVERQLSLVPDSRLWKPYVMSIFLFLQMGAISASPAVHWLNRGRGRIKIEDFGDFTSSRLDRTLTGNQFERYLRLMLKQATSISAHMKMIPLTIFLFAVYPIIAAEDAFSRLSPEVKIPIVTSLLITSLFSCVISIGAYKLSQDERERDALAFGGMSRYQKFTDYGYSLIFTAIGAIILLAYFVMTQKFNVESLLSMLFRSILIVLLVVPFIVLLARKITNLKIDVRFFILFSTIIPIGEMILSGIYPETASYLPSSLLASLAGGEGLYELPYG